MKMGDHQPKKKWYIYFAVLSTTLIVVVTGSCFTWTSPVLPKLSTADATINPIGRPVVLSESAWIVSMMSLGLIFGPSLSILLSKFFCKKIILLLVAMPLLAAQLICAFAQNVQHFLIARFLMGVASGAVWSVLPNYIAEISEDDNRGFMGSLAGVMSTGGSLIPYLIGPYISIRAFAIVSLVPLILYFVIFGCFIPASPYDLIIENNDRKAEESLRKLRGSAKIQKELDYISSSIRSLSDNEGGFTELLRDPGLAKALKICVVLMVFQQLSGIQAVGSYTQTIFELAGSAVSSEISAMIVGTVSLISTMVSSKLIDTMGRKILITASFSATALSLFTLAIYFSMQSYGMNISQLYWLPIVTVIIYMFSFNLGLGVLPWVILGELFPSNVKAAASTITSLSNFCMSFMVTGGFPHMVQQLGMGPTFFAFGVIMVLGVVFCVLMVPETKGKSLWEIEKMLKS